MFTLRGVGVLSKASFLAHYHTHTHTGSTITLAYTCAGKQVNAPGSWKSYIRVCVAVPGTLLTSMLIIKGFSHGIKQTLTRVSALLESHQLALNL